MEEGEQRRGEEMGLTVKQRQAVMEELRKQYRHASKKEKSRILDGFVDLTHLNRSYARSTLRARGAQGRGPAHHPRASVYKGRSSLRSRSSGICQTGSVASVSFPFLDIHSEYGSEFMNNHQGPLPSARAHHPGTVTSIQEE